MSHKENPFSPRSKHAREERERKAREEYYQARVTRMNMYLRGAEAREILQSAIEEEFAGEIALVSSFGAEAAISLHLVSQIDPALPVIFLDTHMHFLPTLQYRDKLLEELGLTNVHSKQPDPKHLETTDPENRLHQTDPDKCCEIRKVLPLDQALEPFSAWVTGRKRFHGGDRSHLPVFEFAGGKFKVNPLAGWDAQRVADYFDKYDLPRHGLVKMGYPSIGCWPCTNPVEQGDNDDPRAGRWQGTGKRECGIHLPH